MKPCLSTVAAVLLGFLVAAQDARPAFAVTTRLASSDVQDKQHIVNGPIAELVADTRAGIGWSSRGSAEFKMLFGTDPNHLEQSAEVVAKARGHNHHATLDKLKPDTVYYFRVVNSENESVSDLGTFRTLPEGSTPVTRKVIVP